MTGSIPNVEFDWFFFEGDIFDFEVNGGDLSFLFSKEVTFSESPKECSFSNIAIAYDDNLISFLILVVREISLLNHLSINLVNK